MAVAFEAPDTQWEWKGKADAPIVLTGHSHCNAYFHAVVSELVPAAGIRFLLPESPDKRPVPRLPDAEYWRIASDARNRVLAVVWQGNQHNAFFLFDFHEPVRLHDHGESGTVLPASMISALFEPTLDELESELSSVNAERLVLLGTPPPKSDFEIRAGLLREPLLLRAAAAVDWDASTMRITPAAVRVGMWKVLQDDLEARAARLGAIFVRVPASAQTPDGCLKPAYSWGDATHANGAFGALMLSELEAALELAKAAWAR